MAALWHWHCGIGILPAFSSPEPKTDFFRLLNLAFVFAGGVSLTSFDRLENEDIRRQLRNSWSSFPLSLETGLPDFSWSKHTKVGKYTK
jgi:hypothetical protein